MDNSIQAGGDPKPRIDTIGVLLKRWKFITLWVLIVTVLAGLMTSALKNRYEAIAYLLVNPSTYKSSTLDQPPLEVDVYQRILTSPELVASVKERLGFEDMTIEQLLRQMKVGLTNRRTVRETSYAPVILLQVLGYSPERCQKIANAWADEATSASLRIKGTSIQADNERIRKQFEDTEKLLVSIEDDLTSFDTRAQLTEKKAELQTLRKQLTTEQEKINQLLVDYSASQARLKDLKRSYDTFFINGVWVGTLYGLENGENAMMNPKDIAPETLQFLLARNDMVEKSRKFTNYKIQEHVEIVKRQYKILINKILRFEQDIEDMRLRLATEKARLAALEKEVVAVPERLPVAKAITDDALWQQRVSAAPRVDDITSEVLVSEEVNPIWLTAQARIQYLKPEISSMEARLKSYESLLNQLRTEQADLDSTVVLQTQNAANLETEMLLAKERYEQLSSIFLLTSHDIMYEEEMVSRYKEEIEDSRQQVARLTSATLELNEYTVEKEMERERLNRELTTVKGVHNALALKYQEARIVELEVSGDLQVVSEAVLPQTPIGPSRVLYILAAFLASLIFFSLLVLASEYVRQQPI